MSMAHPDSAPDLIPASGPAQVLAWSEIQLVKRHPSILDRGRTVLVIIDMQEKLMPVMKDVDSLRAGTIKLLRAAAILDVPVLVTEQYRKGLGPTDAMLAPYLDRAEVYEKMSFSALGDDAFSRRIGELKPTHALLVGIETHVCVSQTALDLSIRRVSVSVASDAVSSRRSADRAVALQRLRAAGIIISSSEALIMELTAQSRTQDFKRILEIIK